MGSDAVKNLVETEIAHTIYEEPTVVLSEKEWVQIHEWHYLAIRQLARIAPIPKEEKWLRKTLNLQSDVNVLDAVDKLFNLGLLTQIDGQFMATNVSICTEQNIPSESIKIHHEQMGALAIKAIRNYDVNTRNFQSCTFLMDNENLFAANNLIEKFINDLNRLVDSPKNKSVYQLNIQLFPLAVIK
jgi:uncharacterized protein (TIGR02147 family)